jgi:ABC-type uncharacterized transport system substrate-binding protein
LLSPGIEETWAPPANFAMIGHARLGVVAATVAPLRIWRAALVLAIACWAATAALAHPHVYIVVRSEIVYAPDGRVASLRHAWTFDESFSAYLSQGLDANKDGKLSREELAPLAKENVESLVDNSYFTVAKAAGKGLEVAAPTEHWMESDGKLLTLHFVLPLKTPASGRTVSLEVYDPNYFISFMMAEGDDAVKLTDAPKGCTVSVRRPKAIDPQTQKSMTESFFNSLSASSDFGGQFAGRALAACP